MVLDGEIDQPRLDLLLDSPNETLGIKAMRLALNPSGGGYDYKASGGSRLGPFTSNGKILLPQNGATVITVAALDAGGAHASGALKSLRGAFIGRLTLANGTLGGTLDFSPAGKAQRIEAHLTAAGASFPDCLCRTERPRRRCNCPRRRAHDGRRKHRRAWFGSRRIDARAAHGKRATGQRQRASPCGICR